VTEILNTPGVRYAGPLPEPHALSTVYTAAVAVGAAEPETARWLIGMLSAPEAAEMRAAAGFSA
jgi:molybdate transport system substrate-binding protein